MLDHLSGISNYCFRWCERCPFTRRCAVHGFDRQVADRSDLIVPAVFPALSGSYASFQHRLDLQLRREGTSLAAVEAEPILTTAELGTSSRNMVVDHLQSSEWSQQWHRSADFDNPVVQAVHELNWYIILLGPKIQRVLRSEEESADPRGDFYYFDARRTAYLVVVSLARATAAVTVLLEHGIEPRAQLLKLGRRFLRLSVSLRRKLPDISLFPRPYWDHQPYRAQILAFYDGKPPINPFLEGMYAYRGERAPDGT